jgi:agmatinase/guanidinopropionase
MDYKPISGRDFPRFSAIKTFFRLPHVAIDADYDVALVGVPFDGGVSYRPGARMAPTRVREMSALGRGYHWARGFDFTRKLKVADVGDAPTVPVDLQQSHERIEAFFKVLLSHNKKFVAVGGDHSTTLPILKATSERYATKLSFVHFDAHLDTYPAAWGVETHHGSFLRLAIERGYVDPRRVLQIGIRGPLAAGDDLDFVRRHGVTVRTVDDVRNGSLKSFCESLPAFEGPTYLSFDIDCLDPAFAPGTGTPVVGGLTTYETQTILRSLQLRDLVGCDVVEVCPPYDVSDITSLAAVDVMFESLSLMAARV